MLGDASGRMRQQKGGQQVQMGTIQCAVRRRIGSNAVTAECISLYLFRWKVMAVSVGAAMDLSVTEGKVLKLHFPCFSLRSFCAPWL